MTIYGGNGDGTNELSKDVPTVIRQTMDTVADATGVDMTETMKQPTPENALRRTATGKQSLPFNSYLSLLRSGDIFKLYHPFLFYKYINNIVWTILHCQKRER